MRRLVRWLLRLRGSPEAIARGVAIGMVVAFTPTVGVQMPLALGIATLADANRPVAIVPTWLTNPLTMGPVYLFDYAIGSLLWSGPPAHEVARGLREAAAELSHLGFWHMRAPLAHFLELGIDVFVPMMIGGLVVGAVAGCVAYPLTLRSVVALRQRRLLRKRARRRRRLQRMRSDDRAEADPPASHPLGGRSGASGPPGSGSDGNIG